MRETDSLRRFLFEGAPLRGHWVHLEDAWAQARAHQSHPPQVMSLLGQALAASALLAACLKFRGTLTLQVRGQGDLPLLIVQCTHDRQIRGLAQLRDGVVVDAASDLPDLVGDGTLSVVLDNHDGGEPWQGIVPLAGASLAQCLEAYFETSEQLPTRLVLAADDWRAGGLLLQKLPQPARDGEGATGQVLALWDEASLLLDTLQGPELLNTAPQTLLQRLLPPMTCVCLRANRCALPAAAAPSGWPTCCWRKVRTRPTTSSPSRVASPSTAGSAIGHFDTTPLMWRACSPPPRPPTHPAR